MANLIPDVRIFADLDGLSHAAADLFAAAAADAVQARGRFLVALSGGTTPAPMYSLLANMPYRSQVEWEAVQVFWGDERCVPVEDLENSYRQAHDILLGLVPIPTGNIHRVETELEPEAAAVRYASKLQEFSTPPLSWPRFDLVLLGMGSDGHTASLFPGSPVSTGRATLAVTAQYEGRPAQRVTLTPEVFNSARKVIFLVSGEGKAEALKAVLYGKAEPEQLPAQRIQPADGMLIWMVDRAAASAL